jgi:hypothetical protein
LHWNLRSIVFAVIYNTLFSSGSFTRQEKKQKSFLIFTTQQAADSFLYPIFITAIYSQIPQGVIGFDLKNPKN